MIKLTMPHVIKITRLTPYLPMFSLTSFVYTIAW